jgi:hypothetical protein
MRAKGEGPWSPEAMEEDERRLAEFERTRMGVPWDEIKAWMESWGKPDQLPRPQPRKLKHPSRSRKLRSFLDN